MSSAAVDLPASAAVLLDGLVDYAGLFPPAALSMADAAAEYGAARAGTDAWILGRFIVPASRLPELAAVLPPAVAPPRPWRVSAVVGATPDRDLANVTAFDASAIGRAVVDAIEVKPEDLDALDRLADRLASSGVETFVEVPPDGDLDAWMHCLRQHGLGAKIRTGGVTAAAFPAPAAVAAFLAAALRAGVPFKATAGLHHPLRGAYRLTYDADAAAAPMYGYLNLLLATAALAAGATPERAAALLIAADPASLQFGADGIAWQGERFPLAQLRELRATRLVGFGSCSFREPVDEGRALIDTHR